MLDLSVGHTVGHCTVNDALRDKLFTARSRDGGYPVRRGTAQLWLSTRSRRCAVAQESVRTPRRTGPSVSELGASICYDGGVVPGLSALSSLARDPNVRLAVPSAPTQTYYPRLATVG
jgi:hypothetical protein